MAACAAAKKRCRAHGQHASAGSPGVHRRTLNKRSTAAQAGALTGCGGLWESCPNLRDTVWTLLSSVGCRPVRGLELDRAANCVSKARRSPHEKPFRSFSGSSTARVTSSREPTSAGPLVSGTFVDFDVGLNTAVNKLRTRLEIPPRSRGFIETVGRRGYGSWRVEADPSRAARPDTRPSGLPRAESGPARTTVEGQPGSRGDRGRDRVGEGSSSLAAPPRWPLGLSLAAWPAGPLADVPVIRSIAVLPPDNVRRSRGGVLSQMHDGRAHHDLAAVRSLRVISRQSVMRYMPARSRCR